MFNTPKFSIIVPVYNRPQEVAELLESLTKQIYRSFEVLVIEDGSTQRCQEEVDKFRDQLTIHYFFKPNTGPGPSRNFGYHKATGEYFVVFDSDCIIPPTYFQAVNLALNQHLYDAWGGPDRAHPNFTAIQRAMGYTMSSIFTTGGIRGGKKRIGWFQPRSFNMGISRRVFELTQGFVFDRYAEDIEFSIRMKESNFKVGLIPEAYVYHKRRSTFSQFYQQVFNFGRGRALVGKKHPHEIKLAHWFPSFFLIAELIMPVLPIVNFKIFTIAFFCFSFYLSIIFIHSLMVNKNFWVAVLSIPAAILQLSGYGAGFLNERFKSR